MSTPPSELDATDRTPGPDPGTEEDSVLERCRLRLVTGVLAEGGRVDKQTARAAQASVEAGAFDPDAAAAKLWPGLLDTRQEQWLEERSKSLMRDLVMAPKLRGLSGAGRSVRKAGRNLFAYVFTQLFVLALFALLFAAGLGLLRYNGVEVEGHVDRALRAIGLEPGAGSHTA